MRYALIIIFLSMLTGAVAAQQPRDVGGPPPDLRMQMEQARSNARTAIMNSLSADHRTQVLAIVNSFNSGDLSMCQAAEKIDGVLSASESAQAIAQAQKMRESFMARRVNGDFAPPPPPPDAPVQTRVKHHKPDAGEVVVMVAALP